MDNLFDTGITGFMLLATSLVMLMTPGLAFFYGGLAGKRNILGIMMQSFVSMGITTIMWCIEVDPVHESLVKISNDATKTITTETKRVAANKPHDRGYTH